MRKNADPVLATFEALFGPEFDHGKKFDLERLRAALSRLGAPHEKLPPVLHVAGTNGKGSAIAFMRAIAEAAGLRVHAFTKPHLFQLSERFIVADNKVDDHRLVAIAERVAAIDRALTQFDAQVAAALLLFSETPADLVLLETGMGGRGDSTNVIERPALAIITPIGLDHQEALGPSIADIAAHKAGVLKPGAPAVVAAQDEEVSRIIEAEAQRVGAPLLRQGVEWDAHLSGGRLIVQTQTRVLDMAPPALFGPHQIGNAGLATAALLQWRDLEDAAFAAGVAWARCPGRLQPLMRGPFSAPIRGRGGEVWVDCGHNENAAAALARALEAMQRRRHMRIVAVVGMRARKHAPAFLAKLAPAVTDIIGVPLAEEHIAAGQIAWFANKLGVRSASASSLANAVASAADGPRVLICGSFLLAAEALAAEGG